MKPAIRVENLSKRYQIGAQKSSSYRTLRESIMDTVSAPLRTWQMRRTRSKSDEFWALRNVSFDVQPGDVVGIVGRNGAGKSTLLKILSRIIDPTEGKATVRGRMGSLLEVGTGFHPELTGRENIYLNGSILGMGHREIARKFDEIVAFSEIERFLDTPVKRYSSGMYVRLAFAVAAYLEPEILIIDEVLAVGDAAFQRRCIGKMNAEAKKGRTILFVSHSMQAVSHLCRHAILLEDGAVSRYGPVDTVIQAYMGQALSADDGRFELSSHPARDKASIPIIHSLELSNGNGTKTSTFTSGSQLCIDIGLHTAQTIKEPRLAIAMEDGLGRRLTTLADYFTTPVLAQLRGSAKVRCTIPRLNLGTGRYLLSVSIATKKEGLIDSLDNVAWIDVESCNIYENGEPYSAVYGPVLEKSLWGTESR
jgi:lipopolysaccharide transport system ATP-binding protein